VSELRQRHEFYELREQYIVEQYWPAGEAAGILKAELIGLITAQRIQYSEKTARRIETIIEMLRGTFKPPPENRPGVTKEQMKQVFGK